ncbi:MAG: pantoate--beta-alanine ligase, partial [Armatimonadetes bacterium]|nr:pantoate--beta-alanine ligase [Armatimonadota bacterium]
MISVRKIGDLREEMRLSERPVLFVPTMGFFHEGHLSLIKIAASGREGAAFQ